MSRARFKGLVEHLAAARPDLADPIAAISDGRVLVDGKIMDNPRAQVRADAPVVVRENGPLRGEAKLRGALDAFAVDVTGRVALDAGAAAGGFTRVLLNAGAARVYAVDAGHGQLLGSLRQDQRVVNLEATNLGDLSDEIVPDTIAVVTLDLSYLSISAAVPQLERLTLTDSADLIALVKPMFELAMPSPPTDRARLRSAVARAAEGVERAPWRVVGRIISPVRGANGAIEFFIHARRR
ncbi:MAG: TlyA family rRNA (cytidine-2'-O)-methyltransferase [Actinobacteria bacterium]|nr:TlyA family rRNA (cytidine-2'-O)-methyltransferase [Actinomycetota bacterium]